MVPILGALRSCLLGTTSTTSFASSCGSGCGCQMGYRLSLQVQAPCDVLRDGLVPALRKLSDGDAGLQRIPLLNGGPSLSKAAHLSWPVRLRPPLSGRVIRQRTAVFLLRNHAFDHGIEVWGGHGRQFQSQLTALRFHGISPYFLWQNGENTTVVGKDDLAKKSFCERWLL